MLASVAGPLYSCFAGLHLLGFSGLTARLGAHDHAAIARRASSGTASGKGFKAGSVKKKKKPKTSEESEEESSTELTQFSRSGKSKALTTSKLKDLRDKTLALRQKREAELDEYEEGRALIAKYGLKAGVMPEKVAQRAAKRGMVIGGSFYAAMLAVFAGAILLFKTQELIIPPTLMAFVTLFLVGLAIAGSSYGLMSASWDADKEGTVLGVEEFGENVKAIGEGFRRLSMQNEYEKAISSRRERRKLLQAKEEKKTELLNK